MKKRSLPDEIERGEAMAFHDLKRCGFDGTAIRRLVEAGRLQRVRGPENEVIGYLRGDLDVEEHLGWDGRRAAAIARRHPGAVLCYHAALRFHGLTDEDGATWTAAVKPRKNRKVRMDGVHLLQWTDERRFNVGVTREKVLGRMVSVTDPERTLVDCMSGGRWAPEPDVWQAALAEVLRRSGGSDEPLVRMMRHAQHLGVAGRLMPMMVAARSAVSAGAGGPRP